MKLPEEANRAVWLRLEQLKEVHAVSHVTFAEIIGREKGLKDGRAEGIKEGLKESLREALKAKFPEEGESMAAEHENEQNIDRLKVLHRAAVLALSPEDFRARISAP